MQEFSGKDSIKIAIANAYGLDKKTWDIRLEFTELFITENEIAQEILTCDADEPLLMQKAINALRDAEAGIPTGYIMGLDATSSGIQIMSCLTGCERGARNSNLIDTGKREDAYSIATEAMNRYVTVDTSRADMKEALMTVLYGSTAEPKRVFGEDTPELAAFYKAISEEFPGAMQCLEDIQSCWQGDVLAHTWIMPDGHVARIKVTEMVDKKIEVDELGHATFTHRAEINAPSEYGLSLVANVVHSVDGYIVREMYRRASLQGFEILTIHDSFWCSPNHMNELRANYREILAEIAESDLLASILNQITGGNGTVTKMSDRLPQLIRESNYALS